MPTERIDREPGVASGRGVAALVLGATLASAPAPAQRLADEPGRNATRVFAAPFALETGVTVTGARLAERLERLDYDRVRRRPQRPGEFFWGHEVFWIYRRAHRWDGRPRRAELLRLSLDRGSERIESVDRQGREEGAYEPASAPWLEPELLSESLDPDRARRVRIRLDELPEHVWRSLLAIEDSRFFEHPGVDGRAVARALLENARAGKVTQGGSTITQQLVKMRDLSPKRTLGRKASEALRALAVEAEHDKREILEAYLDSVYLGHLEGVEIYGYGAGSRAFFSKRADQLDLGEAALLAAMVQAPNRLSPVRHPERAAARRDLVLRRMGELGWAEPRELAAARGAPPRLRPHPPSPAASRHLLVWVAEEAGRQAPRRMRKGRGAMAETWLDPVLQGQAEEAVRSGLAGIRRRHRHLARGPLAAALVAIDTAHGGVVALVGGDPQRRDDFDRARRARRQPGSTVKPLVLLEALDSCGFRRALHAATRVADRPLTIDQPTGPWRPVNFDGGFRGVVSVREALVDSLNVPFVRLGRWCGFEDTAQRFRRAGYALPGAPPPSFVLGSVETTPLELAAAFTAFANGGRVLRPRPLRRLERSSGRGIETYSVRARKVASPAAAYLVRDLLRDAVDRGTARPARIPELDVFGKTGTSSSRRDAWFVGGAGRLVTAVWIGLDDGSSLGLTGASAAAPIWRSFMEGAVGSRPVEPLETPPRIVTRWVDASTGLLLRGPRSGAYPELFRRGTEPGRRRWYRADRPVPEIE